MLALVRQFPIASGVVEGNDPKSLPPGTLTKLQNAVWRKINRVDKRYGTVALGTVSAGRRLFTRGDELCAIDDTSLYSYSEAERAFVRIDDAPNVGITWETLNDTFSGIASMDAVYLGGYVAHAWVNGDPTNTATTGVSYIEIRDRESGAVVASKRISLAATIVRLLVVGTFIIYVVYDGSRLLADAWDTSTQLFSGQTTLRGDVRTTYGRFDACAVGSGFVVAYENTSNALKLYSYSTALVETASGGITGETGNGIRAIGIDGASGEALYVVYSVQSTHVTRRALADPATLAQTVAPFTVEVSESSEIGVCRFDATRAAVAYTVQSAGAPDATKTFLLPNDGVGAPSYEQVTYATWLASRPFMIGARAYAIFADNDVASPSADFRGSNTYLVEISQLDAIVPHRYLGKIDSLIGGRTMEGTVPSGSAVSATKVLVATPFFSSSPQLRREWRVGARLVELTVDDDLPPDFGRATLIGREAYVTVGPLFAYDGALFFDYGFPRPLLYASSFQSAGTLTGTFFWAFGLEYRSAAGVLHRSAIGTMKSALVDAGFAEHLQTFVPALTAKIDIATDITRPTRPILPVVYRTKDAGTELYRVTFEPVTNLLPYALTAQLQTFVDDLSDTSIDGAGTDLDTRPQPYTTGGILDDVPPPAALTQVLHRGRLFVLAGDGRTIWVSKRFDDDLGVAPGFNESLVLFAEEDLVGLASMDEKLIAFSANRPYYLLGDGPTPNGENTDYGPLNPIQADVGLTNPRSLVSTPDGIMFQSARGFFLLTRGLELVQIGLAVADTIDAYPNVTSAVLVPDQNQVRWTCNAADGATGRTIVFDYATKQWSIFKYTANGVTDGVPIADAVLWKGVWTFVTAAGSVFREDATTHLDGRAIWVRQSGEIAWIAEGGPLGWQHIRRAFLLGDRESPVGVKLSFGFNHAESYAQTYSWTSDQIDDMGDGINVGLRVGSQNGASPRCRSFRLAWEDVEPLGDNAYGTGEGFNLSAIGIEYIPRPDMDRRSAKARA